jgi:hypothetical protein
MITAQDVQALLTSSDAEPTLVLVEGRAEVVSEKDLRSGRYAGALVIASRSDLCHGLGGPDPDQLDPHNLDELANRLSVTVRQLGG